MEENLGQKKLEKKVDDILEIVQFIKNNSASKDDIKDMATKDDIKDMATKDHLAELSSRMATKDDIVLLESKMEKGFFDLRNELRGVKLELEEIKKDLKKLEERTRVDDNALVSDNFKLRKRVERLEKQVKFLLAARS